jgi:hypothetical protein
MAWKFQPPSWKDSRKRSATRHKIRKVELRSDFYFAETRIGEESTRVTLRPAVTTFSDHIVISYPTEQFKNGGILTILSLAENLIAAIAAAAMRLGLLIRGGATIGQLYHSGNVVFGEAMVEAYQLESRVSKYPRISVSHKIYSRTNESIFIKDDNGITHLNYFSSMMWAGVTREAGRLIVKPLGDDLHQRMVDWLADCQRVIAENIAKFEEAERWNELAKWVWFKNRLAEAASRPGIFPPRRSDEGA